MRLATWNVNSILPRMPRLLEWLERIGPDVACLQETKVADDRFPRLELSGLGYEVAELGQGAWNGVAIVSRVGLADIATGLDGDDGWDGAREARAIRATCAGVRIWSVYVPNGREPSHAHYSYKLRWLDALRGAIAGELDRGVPLAVCGDFNIAPTDADVWDPAAFENSTHVTPAERQSLTSIRALGLEDVVPRPLKYDRPFTYWDYRAGMFHKNMGMRIDLVLMSAQLASTLSDAYVDRDMRKGTLPSDHAPVVVDVSLPSAAPISSQP
ncbi:MAG TPA: exodeoxyribonuclease III [Candidatus Dormibacteraeota bacterium]|jgi:exodeoxyribonuclease-3|nr:exodeoxyribonuclease III [Candidatus Dormibacteraeota bacterium]